MHHPIQMKPADTENRLGKLIELLYTSLYILCLYKSALLCNFLELL